MVIPVKKREHFRVNVIFQLILQVHGELVQEPLSPGGMGGVLGLENGHPGLLVHPTAQHVFLLDLLQFGHTEGKFDPFFDRVGYDGVYVTDHEVKGGHPDYHPENGN